MLTVHEQRLLVHYLANAASCLHHRDREAKGLVEWITDNGNRTLLGSGKRASRTPGRRRKRSRVLPANLGHQGPGLDDLLDPEELQALEDCADGPTGRQWSRLGEALRSKCAAAKSARSDRTAQRLRCLGRTMELNRTDVDILDLMLRYHTQPMIESMIDDVFGHTTLRGSPLNLKGPALPALLGVSANAVLRRFRADAPLVRSGLVCIDGNDGELTLVNRLHRLATLPGGPGLDVHRLLLGEASPSELEWSDFDHLAHDRDHVEKLLGGALDTGAAGVNVLLYGPPGTGKTELCKVLAGRLGVELHSVGEADDDGDEPTRHERLQELRLAQRLTARGRRSLLLFDEMEDLLSVQRGRRGRLCDCADRNVSERRAGLEAYGTEADPSVDRGRLVSVGKRATCAPVGSAGVVAAARTEGGMDATREAPTVARHTPTGSPRGAGRAVRGGEEARSTDR